MRGNSCYYVTITSGKVFQFTPLHERQPRSRKKSGRKISHFNSRLYMRGNESCKTYCTASIAFQFTPLHERQPFHQYIQQQQVIFQFTPLHERQLLSQAWQLPLQEELFQFTPLHERQLTFAESLEKAHDFNSRLYMRGNRPRRGESGQRKHFNSRLYMRGNKPPLQLRQQTEVYFNSRLYMRGND